MFWSRDYVHHHVCSSRILFSKNMTNNWSCRILFIYTMDNWVCGWLGTQLDLCISRHKYKNASIERTFLRHQPEYKICPSKNSSPLLINGIFLIGINGSWKRSLILRVSILINCIMEEADVNYVFLIVKKFECFWKLSIWHARITMHYLAILHLFATYAVPVIVQSANKRLY